MIQNIAGSDVKVTYLIPTGANPHLFEPTPSIIRELHQAKMMIGIHPGFDGWIRSFVPPSTHLLWLYSEYPDMSVQDAHLDESGTLSAFNPHIWLSLPGAQKICRRMTDWLCQVDPENETLYRKNSSLYLDSLNLTHQRIHTLMSKISRRAFFQWHPAWNYFASDYGLFISGTLEQGHGDEASLKYFQKLTLKAKMEHISVVVIDLYQDEKTALALCKEINGRPVRLSTMGNPGIPGYDTYIGMMWNNALKLAAALAP